MPKFRMEQRKNPERKLIMDEMMTGTGEVETTPAGENEQESAETAPETAAEGANEQAHAEPAPAEQTPEQNAAFAAARRRAEAQAAHRAQMEKDALVARIYQGQTNPYTNRPIMSERDLMEYEQQYQADQIRQAGIDPGMINRMIEQNPVVQQARATTARVRQEEAQKAMEAQIAEISKLDPSVTDFNSLVRHPNFQQFDQMARRGYSLVDAFKLANYDQITGKKAAAAKQQAMNQVNGKSHLNATKSGGAGEDISIPDEEMEYFRNFFPDLSKKQIMEKYKKFK